MILPDKWGQGAIFSYSGINGERKAGNSLWGRLSGDRFGIVFGENEKCTLSIVTEKIYDIYFTCVMTDIICARIKSGMVEYRVDIVFADNNTVLIGSDYAINVVTEFSENATVEKITDGLTYKSGGEVFSLCSEKAGGNIIFAFSKGKDSPEKVQEALKLDVNELVVKKLRFYESFPTLRIPNENIEKLYYKCISVLSGSVNTGEGIIPERYISPARGSMEGMYSYWSALCTLGMRHIAPEIASETLWGILDSQAGDGMISAKVTPEIKSSGLNPPVLAWCFFKLYEINRDKDMLVGAYPKLKRYLHYIMESRDINKNQLLEWLISENGDEAGVESTRDNSPSFDDGVILDSVDFTSYFANEARYMKKIAEEIDKHGEGLYWDVVFERCKTAMNDYLFDDDHKIYYDRAVVSGMFKKVNTSASFLPLFAGVCENRQAMALLRFLNNEDKFNLIYGIPSVAKDEDAYEDDMWRGPSHPHINYMISKGLDTYAMHDKANEIKAKTLDAVIREYMSEGVLFQYYSADGRVTAKNLGKKTGNAIPFIFDSENVNLRDFAPTASVILDMLLSGSKKLPSRK